MILASTASTCTICGVSRPSRYSAARLRGRFQYARSSGSFLLLANDRSADGVNVRIKVSLCLFSNLGNNRCAPGW